MAKSRMAMALRFVAATLAIAATGVGLAGMASAAPTFDVDGYSTCTATTVPAANEGFDAVVTRCCVQHAGVPADTRYGVGCVAAADSLSTDERPTIVLPTRPSPPEDSQDIQDALKDLGDRPLPDPTP